MRRNRRLPKAVEKEFAKFCGTLGFTRYAEYFWNLSTSDDEPVSSAPAHPLSDTLLERLLEQARHDPAIIAAGAGAIPHLQQNKRNLCTTWGVSSAKLFAPDFVRPDVLFVVGRLDDGSVDEIAGFEDGLRAAGASTFQIVVTEQLREAVDADLTRLSQSSIIFWREHYEGQIGYSSRILAVYIHALGPAAIVCSRSVLGYETIGSYGRALGPFHRLFALLAVADDATAFDQIYNLRICAPTATILVESEAEARIVRPYLADIGGPGVEIAPIAVPAAASRFGSVFGSDFSDGRSALTQKVIGTLLGRIPPRAQVATDADTAATETRVDISVVAVFHREHELAARALASLRDMVEHATRAGLRVETHVVLDKGDDATRDIIQRYAMFADMFHDVSLGDPALARNYAAERCAGRFVTFLDGDDLWGKNWLTSCFEAATRTPESSRGVWHCQVYFVFFASDCNRVGRGRDAEPVKSCFYLQTSSDDADFEPKDLLLESLWTVNSFALREIYLRFPYRPNDWDTQLGIEDWRWNRETLGHGLVHRVVPDTVHIIRMKETGSLGQEHNARKLLPFLP